MKFPHRPRMPSALASFGVAALFQIAGCASIVGGANQSLSVETETAAGARLDGAACKLVNDRGIWFITTPGSLVVNRSYGDLDVRCEKPGHLPGLLVVKSSTKSMAAGNLVFGGLIGLGVDVGTGAAYDYPELIKVRMGSIGVSP